MSDGLERADEELSFVEAHLMRVRRAFTDIEAENKRLVKDYLEVVDKFDACRAALARRYEAETGKHAVMPDDARNWHEWLIEQSDAKVRHMQEQERKVDDAVRALMQEGSE